MCAFTFLQRSPWGFIGFSNLGSFITHPGSGRAALVSWRILCFLPRDFIWRSRPLHRSLPPRAKSVCSSLDLFPQFCSLGITLALISSLPFQKPPFWLPHFIPTCGWCCSGFLQTALCCPHLFRTTGTEEDCFPVGNTWAISIGNIAGCARLQECIVGLALPHGHVITCFISRAPEEFLWTFLWNGGYSPTARCPRF